MSSRKPSSKKAEQVLDAARQLFTESGFAATSMDDIANLAEVSKATVYSHYTCKETLFGDVVRQECQRSMVGRAIDENIANDCPIETSLIRIARAYLATLMLPEIRGLSRMVSAESMRFPELGQIYYDSGVRETRTRLARFLEDAQREGTLADCDVRTAANQFLTLVRGELFVGLLYGRTPGKEEAERTITEAVTTFMARYAKTA